MNGISLVKTALMSAAISAAISLPASLLLTSCSQPQDYNNSNPADTPPFICSNTGSGYIYWITRGLNPPYPYTRVKSATLCSPTATGENSSDNIAIIPNPDGKGIEELYIEYGYAYGITYNGNKFVQPLNPDENYIFSVKPITNMDK